MTFFDHTLIPWFKNVSINGRNEETKPFLVITEQGGIPFRTKNVEKCFFIDLDTFTFGLRRLECFRFNLSSKKQERARNRHDPSWFLVVEQQLTIPLYSFPYMICGVYVTLSP